MTTLYIKDSSIKNLKRKTIFGVAVSIAVLVIAISSISTLNQTIIIGALAQPAATSTLIWMV
jgi:hypothetical protein